MRSSRERSRPALPVRRRSARRPEAPEARRGIGKKERCSFNIRVGSCSCRVRLVTIKRRIIGEDSSAAATSGTVAPVTRASSSAVVAAAGRHKVGTGLSVLLGILVLLAAGYGVYALLLVPHRTMPFRNFSVSRVTQEGDVVWASLSPDGKYILSLVRDNGLASLSLRNVPTNSITQVQPPARSFTITACDFRLTEIIFILCAATPAFQICSFSTARPCWAAHPKNSRATSIRISRSHRMGTGSRSSATTTRSKGSTS